MIRSHIQIYACAINKRILCQNRVLQVVDELSLLYKSKLREKMSIFEAKKDIFYVIKKPKYARKKTKYVILLEPLLCLDFVSKP